MKKLYKAMILFIIPCLVLLSACSSSKGPEEQQTSQDVQEEVFSQDQFMKDIQPALECLKSCDEELFLAQVDFDHDLLAAYQKDKDQNDIAVLYPSGDPLPKGYDSDLADARYYHVENYNHIQALKEDLQRYMTDDVIASFQLLENDFINFDDALYLVRGGRGYGALVSVPESAKYIEEKNNQHIVQIEYKMFDEHDHDAKISFIQDDGHWKIAHIE